jgi:outer membrane protein TolC
VDLVVPYQIREFDVDVKKALAEAFSHRSDATAFLRRTLEAERELDKAKAENGLNASLDMAVGLSNRGDNPADIYRNPQDYEYVEVRFNLPILDWGRSKSRTETAKANLQLTQQSIEQEKNAFEQEIYTQVTLFEMLQEQVKLTAETDEIADNRYQIAQDRFILSDLSITDLGLAMREKDTAKRDYIIALRDYWRVYYILRLFTLYDFELNQPLGQ